MSDIHALTERAMVMNLSISLWQGYRLDKQASAEITAAKGANSDAARVNKHLVPKEALAAIVTSANLVRTHFYTNTLPWRDNGDRLMTRKLYLTFIPEHEKLVADFNAVVDEFLTKKYPAAVEQASFRMGELFDRADYPSATELRHRFRIGLEIDAVTTANDFRVQIDQDHVDRVRASMEAAAMSRVQTAQADVWKRLMERVGHFADKLGTPDAIFRDSLIANVEDLVEMIPGLNVLDDPEIEQVRLQVKAKLMGHDAKDIRKDPALREELAGEAKAIMDRMQGFCRAFGASTT